MDGLLCVDCPVGHYSNGTGKAPFPTKCYFCEAGKYASATGASTCLTCSDGKLSNAERTSCDNCKAGEYSYQDTECVPCSVGKYAPIPLADDCLTCGAGFFVNIVNALLFFCVHSLS